MRRRARAALAATADFSEALGALGKTGDGPGVAPDRQGRRHPQTSKAGQ
jgi:hypothetical protein